MYVSAFLFPEIPGQQRYLLLTRARLLTLLLKPILMSHLTQSAVI